MGTLNAKQRAKSAVITTKSGDKKFPIPDKAHARAALARINQAKPPLSAEQKAKVRRAANAKLGKKAS